MQTDIRNIFFKPDAEVLQDILNIVAMSDDQPIAYARILTTLVNSGRIRSFRNASAMELVESVSDATGDSHHAIG